MTDNRFELFTISISQIIKDIQKIKMEKMAHFGLKSYHALCLYQLSNRKSGLTAGELAESGKVDKAMVSRELNELTKKGYVVCENPDEKKKYKLKYFLTDAGKHVSEEIDSVSAEIQNIVNHGISEDELKVFYATLNKLCDNFKNYTRRSIPDSNR